MPALPTQLAETVQNLLSVGSSNQTPAAVPQDGKGFLTLLNVGTQEPTPHATFKENRHWGDSDTATPPVSAVPTTAFVSHTTPQEKPAAHEHNERPAPHQAAADTKNRASPKAPAPKAPPSDSHRDASPPAANKVSKAPASDDTSPSTATQQLLEQLQRMTQLMSNILHIMAGHAMPGRVETVSITVQETTLSVSAAQSSSNAPTMADLFKELQQMLADVQQGMQAVNETSDGQSLQPMADMLAANLTQWQQQFSQSAQAVPLPADVIPQVDALLKNAIDLAKAVMPKIKIPTAAASVVSDTLSADKSAPTASVPNISSPTKISQAPVTVQNVVQETPGAGAPIVVAAQAFADHAGANADSGQDGNDSSLPQPATPAAGASATSSASPAASASFSRLLTQAVHVAVPEQIAFHVKTMLNGGGSKISIHLDPAELGKLEIKLSVGADGKTGVIVTADNKDTLNLLQNDMRGLQQALTNAGLKTDAGSLSFNLRGGQQEQGQGDRSQAAQQYQKAAPEDDEALLPSISRSYVVNLAEGLDIKI